MLIVITIFICSYETSSELNYLPIVKLNGQNFGSHHQYMVVTWCPQTIMFLQCQCCLLLGPYKICVYSSPPELCTRNFQTAFLLSLLCMCCILTLLHWHLKHHDSKHSPIALPLLIQLYKNLSTKMSSYEPSTTFFYNGPQYSIIGLGHVHNFGINIIGLLELRFQLCKLLIIRGHYINLGITCHRHC